MARGYWRKWLQNKLEKGLPKPFHPRSVRRGRRRKAVLERVENLAVPIPSFFAAWEKAAGQARYFMRLLQNRSMRSRPFWRLAMLVA
jgi:hypothetical protein